MRAGVVAVLVWCGVAHATAPTVAVLPFKDLSGGTGSVGEAIRETVTTDLKDVPGLKVLERSFVDKVIAEQDLQASKADLDPLSTVKVGKLLGASLIVAGAYQRAAANVRLTARFVRVETGEVVGTAKVDGAAADFLKLQDRVTAELLRRAGIDGKQVRRFAQRTRPKLKSLKPVELYGDAVVETDDQKKTDMLRRALDADPAFVYAARDLDALEKRMKRYEAVAQSEQEKQYQALQGKLAGERDPERRVLLHLQALGALMSARRWHTLAAECRRVLANPPPPSATIKLEEQCAFYLVTAAAQLRDRDAVLRHGESFLKKYPSSIYFQGVEGQMQSAIDHKRRVESGKKKAAEALAQLASRDRWDLCRVAYLYRSHDQYAEAQRLFRACLAVGTGFSRPVDVLQVLVMVDLELADWKAARQDLARLEAEGGTSLRQALELQVPADG